MEWNVRAGIIFIILSISCYLSFTMFMSMKDKKM
jgi:hypothetical protein